MAEAMRAQPAKDLMAMKVDELKAAKAELHEAISSNPGYSQLNSNATLNDVKKKDMRGTNTKCIRKGTNTCGCQTNM